MLDGIDESLAELCAGPNRASVNDSASMRPRSWARAPIGSSHVCVMQRPGCPAAVALWPYAP